MLGWKVTTVNGTPIRESTVAMLYSEIAQYTVMTLGLVNDDKAFEQFYAAKDGLVSDNVMQDPPREQATADAEAMRITEQAAARGGAAPDTPDGAGGDSGPAVRTAARPGGDESCTDDLWWSSGDRRSGAVADPRVLHVDLINLWDQPEQKKQLAAATDTISLANVVTMEQWREAALSWSDCVTESSAGPRTLDIFGCLALCDDNHDDVLQGINPFALRSLEIIHLGGNSTATLTGF